MRDEQAIAAMPSSERAVGAIVGAAMGDALGWPHEDRSRRVGANGEKPSLRLFDWQRKAGGQFNSHIEPVVAGAYSDDTQLLLATARSLQYGVNWESWFIDVELPMWLLYERGGGLAVKAAAQSWADGRPPWANNKLREKYINAGGNGVAMRVLPHVLFGGGRSFAGIHKQVISNGFATHFHPRALVGAALYAYVVHVAVTRVSPIGYGELIDKAFAGLKEWSTFRPEFFRTGHELRRPVALITDEYVRLWDETVEEMLHLLSICSDGMQAGPLAMDKIILEKLGAFGKEAGAGTRSAAAAIFLASRFASDPRAGLAFSAYEGSSDSDTIASMAGAILGAINGTSWLIDDASSLEDREYLYRVAETVHSGEQIIREIHRVKASDIDACKSALVDGETRFALPDGRALSVLDSAELSNPGARTRITMYRTRTSDGQTMHVKIINRKTEARLPETAPSLPFSAPAIPTPDPTPVSVATTNVVASESDSTLAPLFRHARGLFSAQHSQLIAAMETRGSALDDFLLALDPQQQKSVAARIARETEQIPDGIICNILVNCYTVWAKTMDVRKRRFVATALVELFDPTLLRGGHIDSIVDALAFLNAPDLLVLRTLSRSEVLCNFNGFFDSIEYASILRLIAIRLAVDANARPFASEQSRIRITGFGRLLLKVVKL